MITTGRHRMQRRKRLDDGRGGVNVHDLDQHVQWLYAASAGRTVQLEYSHYDTLNANHAYDTSTSPAGLCHASPPEI